MQLATVTHTFALDIVITIRQIQLALVKSVT
jgi:hypothetical protein